MKIFWISKIWDGWARTSLMEKIRFLFERDEYLWLAHCVDGDLVTQAPRLDELYEAAQLMIAMHLVSYEVHGLPSYPFRRPAKPDVIAKFENSKVVIVPLNPRVWPDVPVLEIRIVG